MECNDEQITLARPALNFGFQLGKEWLVDTKETAYTFS